MHYRQAFLQHIAQTSPAPIGLHINKADGIYLYGEDGKTYIDLISGFSVANIGHSNPRVVKAVQEQAAKYMHLIVYGEFIETPQVNYAQLLSSLLPKRLDCIYFTNSGAEATEGAMKLAKRVTGKSKIISCKNAYHGSTQGALSVMGDEYFKQSFRPLLPNVFQYPYQSQQLIDAIDVTTACVIVEPVQAESGIISADKQWLQALSSKCSANKCLLIFDEIQSGFGRTGHLFAFEKLGIIPDVLLLGKALGGGMPLGAFIASHQLMQTLTHQPVLGHITTFGGHPVSCAAGNAALLELLENEWIKEVPAKEQILKEKLQHPDIKILRTAGLWASITFDNFELNKLIVHHCVKNGLVTDWFLFNNCAMRIAPPLCITKEQLLEACDKILKVIDDVTSGNI